MKTKTRLLVAFFTVIGFAVPVGAQGLVCESYQVCVERLISGDVNLDYKSFRMAFVDSRAYSPYDTDRKDQRQRMLVALFSENDLDKAGAVADSIFSINYTDLDAHFVAMIVADETEDPEGFEFHSAVLGGLIRSIAGESDGRSSSSPWVVIETGEEYALLRILGLEFREQSLVDCNGAQCDRMQVFDSESGETFDLYFDVSIAWNHLAGSFGN